MQRANAAEIQFRAISLAQQKKLDEALRQVGVASVGSTEMIEALRKSNVGDIYIGRALCLAGMVLLGTATARREIMALLADAESKERGLPEGSE